jgi:hypothetical protein
MDSSPHYRNARPGDAGTAVCPCCEGTGRVGPDDAACQACWMSGAVPAWRRPLLVRDLDWWHRRQGRPNTSPNGRVAGPCEVCDLENPCRWCPSAPFSLAA